MRIKYIIPLFILLIINISCPHGNYVTCGRGPVKMPNLDVSIISIRQDSLSDKVFLEGKVTDSDNESVVEGANIILLPNSKFILGTVTNKNGIFKIEFDPSKFIYLDVSYIGYHKKRLLINELK